MVFDAKKYNREYKKKHKEKIAKRAKEYYAKNKETMNANARKNYYANREERLKYAKQYREKQKNLSSSFFGDLADKIEISEEELIQDYQF